MDLGAIEEFFVSSSIVRSSCWSVRNRDCASEFFKDLSVTLENGVSEVPSNLVTNIAACEVVIESCVSSNY